MEGGGGGEASEKGEESLNHFAIKRNREVGVLRREPARYEIGLVILVGSVCVCVFFFLRKELCN